MGLLEDLLVDLPVDHLEDLLEGDLLEDHLHLDHQQERPIFGNYFLFGGGVGEVAKSVQKLPESCQKVKN